MEEQTKLRIDMKRNYALIAVSVSLMALTTGCPKIVKDKSGVDAAIQDMERIYTRVDAIKTAARQKNKPEMLTDTDILISYNDAAGFLNGYWKGVIGDVESRQKIDRPRSAYLNEHGYGSVTNFFFITEKKLRALDARESGEAIIIAKVVIDIMDYFFKRANKLEQGARDDFKRFLTGLKVDSWGARFEMPEEPKFWKDRKQ